MTCIKMCICANPSYVARSCAYSGVHPKQKRGTVPEKFWRYHYVWNKQQFKQQLPEFTEFKQFTEFTERKQQHKEQHKELLRQLQQQHKEQLKQQQ